MLADNFADLEFVDRCGDVFTLNQATSPNLFAFREEALQPPGICTKATVRIYPTTDDEQGVLVPFSSFDEAVRFVRELGVRRIGLAAAILGDHYLSAFTSPSQELAERTRKVLTETLGVKFAVAVVGDEYAIAAVRSMTRALIDGRLFRALMLGLPKLAEGQWLELLTDFATDRPPYEILCREELYPLVETVLNPSPANIASAVEEDLRAFYEDLYSKPEMTDLVWLTMFRILSSRMSRHKHYFVFVLYVPLDDIPLIDRIIEGFRTIGEKHEISHEFGFLTPLDFGKRGILEYDYYVDQTDPAERARVAALLADIDPWLGQLCREERAIKTFKFVLGQGCARKEAFLYA
ncbi:MAG: hypothetical protein A4E57_01979 [Syntrophorhabdaceae bacterium PtaU1.Bin034]|nr:MAG: hypothetical protein A4E57_01979 [Syntrophorhabdaceae bacterium PtaU1.Bin034]